MEESGPPSKTTLCTCDEYASEEEAASTTASSALPDTGNQQEGATENYEWGIPLFYNPEQEDADSLGDLVKLSTDEAAPEHEIANHGSEDKVSLKDANDCVDSSRIVSDAAVQGGLPLPLFLRKKKSNEHFYKKMYLDPRKPQHPRSCPLTVTVNYNAVSDKWRRAIGIAIAEILKVSPGLIIEKSQSLSACVYIGMIKTARCYTRGSLRNPGVGIGEIKSKSVIRLTDERESERLNSTAIHEILHALGFEHEHQRRDAGHYLTVFEQYKKDNINPVPYIKPLTPFDRYSIMLYRIGNRFELCDEKNQHYPENVHLSELDKIALNMIYPPCCREFYSPILANNGMYYCNRRVMENHNQPGAPLTATCSPTSGPNCPACRVLSKPHNLGDKWQGRSGFVYCGKEGCGPDVGEPCQECLTVLNVK